MWINYVDNNSDTAEYTCGKNYVDDNSDTDGYTYG